MATYPTDAILTKTEAQEILDTVNEDELARVVAAVSAKARAFLNRVALVNVGSDIVENFRPEIATNVLFLHASPVDTDGTVVVKEYTRGTEATEYTLADNELMVTADDLSARVDLLTATIGSTPGVAVGGGSFVRVTYQGGWSTVPGDILAGAVMQARVDLKRMRGEVGMLSHSRKGESVASGVNVGALGIVSTVADMWRPYRILV